MCYKSLENKVHDFTVTNQCWTILNFVGIEQYYWAVTTESNKNNTELHLRKLMQQRLH